MNGDNDGTAADYAHEAARTAQSTATNLGRRLANLERLLIERGIVTHAELNPPEPSVPVVGFWEREDQRQAQMKLPDIDLRRHPSG